MCEFCEGDFKIETTIGEEDLKISLDEENKCLLKVRLENGGYNITRPILINYCFYCGKKL
jgi:hypothetical protein